MTVKQQRLASKLVENKGNLSMGEAMRQAGYSPATANNPQQVTKSKGWGRLMEQYISDEMILRKLSENVNSESGHISNSAIDIAIKVKGAYKPAKFQFEENPYEKMSDAELNKEIAELEEKIAKRMNPNGTDELPI